VAAILNNSLGFLPVQSVIDGVHMNQITAAVMVLMLSFFATCVQAVELRLGVDPVNAPGIMEKELRPMLDSMRREYALQYVPSRATKEIIQQARSGQINCAYVSLGYAYLLQQLGFVPVLVSEEVVTLALVGKPNLDLAVAKQNSDQSLYYVKNDLFAMFKFYQGKKQVKWAAQAVPSMTSENIMFKLLKEPASLGFIMGDELGLLHKVMRDNLMVYQTEDIGPVYFLVHKEMVGKSPEIRENFLKFHEEFKDTNHKYNYLRIYHFKAHAGHVIEIDKDYKTFLNNTLYSN